MNDLLFGLAADEWSDDECVVVDTNNSNVVNLVLDGEGGEEGGEEGGGIINDGSTSDDDNENDEENKYEEDLDAIVDIDDDFMVGGSAPALSKWKEISLFDDIIVTVGKARREMWLQGKEEVSLIKKNVSELKLPMDVASLAATPLQKIYHTLFGSTSVLCSNFCHHLQLTKLQYLHFLFTFFISCKNQQAVPTMHASMEINSEMLMPLDMYKKIWTDIKKQQGNTKQIELWKVIEHTINQQLKLFFMSDDADFPYLLGFDDDKVHFHYSTTTKMSGLSQQHHVKANKKGLTLHTCAFSATCVPVAVSFQRFGESVQDTYTRTMKDLFGSGAGGLPRLLGVTLASDRGYWEKGLLFDQMMEGGADIIGTVKRVRMVGCCVICRRRNFFLVVLCIFFCCCVRSFVVVVSLLHSPIGSRSHTGIKKMILSHKHQRISPRMATEIPFIFKQRGKERNKKRR